MSDFIQEIIDRLSTQFEPGALAASLAGFISNLIVGVITFAAYYLVWWVLNRVIAITLRRGNADKTTKIFVETLLKYIVLTIGVLKALSAVGIDTSAFLASLGIAGLTIGFAARDALSNLISGLLIFWDRPFVIGDLIEVEGNYGRVESITLRSTRVVTIDGKMLAVPNSVIINTTVASFTNFPNLRIDIDVTIAVTENIDRVREILLRIADEDSDVIGDPPPKTVVTALNDYNIAIQLQAWIIDERMHIPKRFELREKVFKALTAAGVDMPFETFRLEPFEVRQVPQIK